MEDLKNKTRGFAGKPGDLNGYHWIYATDGMDMASIWDIVGKCLDIETWMLYRDNTMDNGLV